MRRYYSARFVLAGQAPHCPAAMVPRVHQTTSPTQSVAAVSSTAIGTGGGGKPGESSNADELQTIRDTDAFRAGYNMGMLSVQLETLRMKLEDNKEVLKTQFASMRDTTRSNHEIVTRSQNDNRSLILNQLQENLQKISSALTHYQEKFEASEEAIKDLTRQQFEALQKHTDDRLENIKDTVKVGMMILIFLLAWIIVLLQQAHIIRGTGHHPPPMPSIPTPTPQLSKK